MLSVTFFLQPVETILSSWPIGKQVVGQVWPVGQSLLTSDVAVKSMDSGTRVTRLKSQFCCILAV